MKITKITLPENLIAPTEDCIIKALKSNNKEPKTASDITSFWHYNWEENTMHELPGLDVHIIEAKLLELTKLNIVRKVPRRGRDKDGYEFFTLV